MLEELRREVVEIAIEMWKAGLTQGAEGNLSARDPETGQVAITCSQLAYCEMTAEDIIIVDVHGEKLWGEKKPSSETKMHTYFYRHRPHLRAVMHTHSEYAIAASIARCSIPPITFGIALNIGSEIVAVDWVEPGSEEMGSVPHEAMLAANSKAALLANHGAVVVASSLRGALEAARAVEEGARMYLLARAFGEPKPIPPDRVAFFFNLWQDRQVGVK